ncbi:Polysaccharide deacetylase-like protein 2 [Elsinoe fawcettii]|nr:Polysaccharide deacetylase-like protein 2 [Elsinoe fawcettii]
MVARSLFFSLLAVASALPESSPKEPHFYHLKARSASGVDEQLQAKKQYYASLAKRQSGTVPVGETTEFIDRSRRGNVPFGATIRSCTADRTIALTFDDGPSVYTTELLDILARYNAKATLFVAGNNGQPGGMDSCGSGSGNYQAVVRRAYAEGHQIGHHTWTHPSLNGLDEQGFKNQIFYNEMAIRNLIGVVPTYLRPPYLECDGQCETRLGGLGYHTISVDLDTNDWRYTDPNTNDVDIAKQTFTDFFFNADGSPKNPRSALVLAHDIHQTTVRRLTEHMLQTGQRAGYRFVTVGECLGDSAENWYRAAPGSTTCNGGTTNPPPTTTQPPSNPGTSNPGNPGLPTTSDGQCGANGRTCLGAPSGSCCSQWGWCGSSTDHCGTGCQSGFGTCG